MAAKIIALLDIGLYTVSAYKIIDIRPNGGVEGTAGTANAVPLF